MKKSLLLIPLLFIGSFTFAADDFPAFPMTIYGNIKIGYTNLAGGTLRVYNSSNQELTFYSITQNGKYGSDNVSIQPLLLNKFNGGLNFKVSYNGKTYVVDSIDDSNKGNGCPSKSSITFVSENCRYDITLKEETTSSNKSGGSSSSGGGGGGSSRSTSKTTNSSSTTNSTKNTNSEKGTNSITDSKVKTNTTENGKTNTQNTVTKNNGQKSEVKGDRVPAQVFTYKRSEYGNGNPSEVLQNGYSREMNNAYKFAYDNGITTVYSIEKAKLNAPLTRIQMAKMLSNYAMNVLGKQPDYTKGSVKFNDVSDKLNSQYDNAVTLAYQLGIMGQNMKNNNFRPNDEVSRAEFATALSRLLYGTQDGNDNYYSTHINKLKQEGIITNDNAKIKEKRGYVMTMLMRTVN